MDQNEISEKQAKGMWCPATVYYGKNRSDSGDMHPRCRCIAGDCMWWIVVGQKNEQTYGRCGAVR
jgi:hypothetical protein